MYQKVTVNGAQTVGRGLIRKIGRLVVPSTMEWYKRSFAATTMIGCNDLSKKKKKRNQWNWGRSRSSTLFAETVSTVCSIKKGRTESGQASSIKEAGRG